MLICSQCLVYLSVVSALLYIRKSSPRRLKSFINAGVSLSLSAEIECICRLYHATLSGQFHPGAMNFFLPIPESQSIARDREKEYSLLAGRQCCYFSSEKRERVTGKKNLVANSGVDLVDALGQ